MLEVDADGANLAAIFGPVRAEQQELDDPWEVLAGGRRREPGDILNFRREDVVAVDAAITDRQYGTKNCRKKTIEQPRMIAAIIGAPPPKRAALGTVAPHVELAKRHMPTTRAIGSQRPERVIDVRIERRVEIRPGRSMPRRS